MDALSRLVELVGLRAQLDLRCLLAGGVETDEQSAPPGELLFHLVLSGRCRLTLDGGEALDLQAGDFVALPRGSAHRVRVLDGEVAEAVAPLLSEESGGLALRRSASGELVLDLLCGRLVSASPLLGLLFATLPGTLSVSLNGSAATAQLQALAALIREEVAAGRAGVQAVVASLANALFALALRAHAESGDGAPGLIRLLGDARLGRVALAVLREPGRDWGAQALADEAGMSRASFMRHFGAAAQQTAGDFVTLVRLTRAATLLRQSRRGTADIGEEVGYQSEAAFNHAFKKALGLTPAAYRRGG